MQRQFTYDLEQGRVYVTIMSAKQETERRGDDRVEVITPFVEVSTKPVLKEDGTRDADAPWGFFKIGNYLYRAHDAYRPTLEWEKSRGWIDPWTTSGLSTPYGEGIRQQSGNEVTTASVRKKINGAIMSALTSFALEVPDWADRSIALHLEAEYQAGLREEERLKGLMEAAVGATDTAKAALDAHLSKMEEQA